MKTTPLVMLCTVMLMAVAALAADPPIETLPYWTSGEQGVVSTGMIWRDCDLDGVIDVFYSNGNDIVRTANTLYLSNGGTLPAHASWTSTNNEYSGHCAVGDIDDDGFPEFIVSNYLGTSWAVRSVGDMYLNRGSLPSVAPDWQTPDSMYTFSCALGDYDNDGDLDIAFASGEGYNSVYERELIYENQNGVFSASPVWQSTAMTAALDITWGDVDNDGDLDLGVTYSDLGATSVYYNNNGTIESVPSWQAATVESGNTLVFGDVNGDGWLDLVVAYNDQLGGSGRFRVYFNNGSGTLNTTHGWQSGDGGYGSALALYDYDGDGDDDLAAGRWFEDIFIYENLGTTFSTAPVWTSDIDVVAEELAWVDISGYGVAEYVDTIAPTGGKSLYYTERQPLYAVDSVVADGSSLKFDEYCYDLVSGWVSMADAPVTDLRVYYRWSEWNDLTVCNWDTVNMAFPNTNKPIIDFFADNAFGPTPLTVAFHNASTATDSVRWDFGDGETSTELSPTHEYILPGYYYPTLTHYSAAGEFLKTADEPIAAYADTLAGDSTNGRRGQPVRLDIIATNYLPLEELTIPFTWSGPLSLQYDSFSTAGLRTEYLARQLQANYDPFNQRAVIRLGTATSGSQQPLSPGVDPVVSLWFTIPSGTSTAPNPVDLIAYSTFAPTFVCPVGSYEPVVAGGQIALGCCTGPSVGNTDGSLDNLVTMGDLTVMIDHLFITLTPLVCVDEGNVDLSSDRLVTMADLTVLIDHLFITLAPLPPCP